MKPKQETRVTFLAKRNALSAQMILNTSSKILANLRELPEYKNAKTVLYYASTGSEVATLELVKDELKSGNKRVLLPLVVAEKRQMFCCEVKNWDELVPGHKDIPEPKVCNNIDVKEVDLVLVPGVVFDKQGFRLGYGKGYYDKFLKMTKAVKIGLTYDNHIVDKLPQDVHDVAMDIVVSEKTVIKVNSAEQQHI